MWHVVRSMHYQRLLQQVSQGLKNYLCGFTLFIGVVCEFICGRRVERIALAIVAILKNHSKALKLLHQNLDDTGLEIRKTIFGGYFASDVQKHRTARLVVCIIEEVSLAERGIRVRRIARIVRKVVNLNGH